MANIYVIRDNVCECDCFVTIQENDGAAKKFFKEFLEIHNSYEFTLYLVADVEYVNEDNIGTKDCYAVTRSCRDLIVEGSLYIPRDIKDE